MQSGMSVGNRPMMLDAVVREQSRFMEQVDEARAICGRVGSMKESLDAIVAKISGGGSLAAQSSNKTGAPHPSGIFNDLALAQANTNEQLNEIDQILSNLRNYI